MLLPGLDLLEHGLHNLDMQAEGGCALLGTLPLLVYQGRCGLRSLQHPPVLSMCCVPFHPSAWDMHRHLLRPVSCSQAGQASTRDQPGCTRLRGCRDLGRLPCDT